MNKKIWAVIELACFIGALLCLTAASLAWAGRWDGDYVVKGTISSTSPTHTRLNLVEKGIYLKVTCTGGDAYVGTGTVSIACTSTTCDRVNFTLGEKFYRQLNNSHDYVDVLCVTGTCTCVAFKGVP